MSEFKAKVDPVLALRQLLDRFEEAEAVRYDAERAAREAKRKLTAAVLEAGMVDCLQLNVRLVRRYVKG